MWSQDFFSGIRLEDALVLCYFLGAPGRPACMRTFAHACVMVMMCRGARGRLGWSRGCPPCAHCAAPAWQSMPIAAMPCGPCPQTKSAPLCIIVLALPSSHPAHNIPVLRGNLPTLSCRDQACGGGGVPAQQGVAHGPMVGREPLQGRSYAPSHGLSSALPAALRHVL